MQFIDYISNSPNILTKLSCPADCQFKDNREIPIVGIPAPKIIKGIIISRDPTTAFIRPYLLARLISPEEWHYKLMTANAPPQWIIKQIATFSEKYLKTDNKDGVEKLRILMENNIYWTHLHKCCTDKSSIEAPCFNNKNARLCADQWLKQELSDAITAGAKFIICVGNDAKAWLQEWEMSDPIAKNVSMIYLPHPSSAANGAWNPKDGAKMSDLTNSIKNLLKSP